MTGGRLRRLAVIPLLFAALMLPVACDFLTASYFPDYLSSAVAARDLDDLIGDSEGTQFFLRVLEGGGGDLLFLGIAEPAGPPQLAILDQGLAIRKHYTEPELADSLGAAYYGGRLGDMTMVDLYGRYVVGSFVFDPLTLIPVIDLQSAGDGMPPWGAGFADPASFAHYVVTTNGDQMEIWKRNDLWSAAGLYTVQLTYPGFGHLRPVLALPIIGDPAFTLLLGFNGGGRLIVGAVIAWTWPEFLGMSGPLLDNPGFFVHQSIPEVEEDEVWPTVDGLVVGTYSGVHQLRDFDALSRVKESRRFGDSHRQTVAYSVQGDYCYLLDHVTKRLYKLATWW